MFRIRWNWRDQLKRSDVLQWCRVPLILFPNRPVQSKWRAFLSAADAVRLIDPPINVYERRSTKEIDIEFFGK